MRSSLKTNRLVKHITLNKRYNEKDSIIDHYSIVYKFK